MKLIAASLVFVIAVIAPMEAGPDEDKMDQEMKKIIDKPHTLLTEQELVGEMNDWIRSYFEYFDKALKEKNLRSYKKDMEILKELMLYNWMFYLSPQLSSKVKKVLPENLKQEKSAADIVEKLRKSISDQTEQVVTVALARYQYAKVGEKSGHALVKEYLEKWLTPMFQKIKNMGSNKADLQVQLVLRALHLSTDPVMVVHEMDIVMCAQTIYLIFYPEYKDEEWAPIKVDVDGKLLETAGKVSTSTLMETNWKAFTEIKVTNEEINTNLLKYYADIKMKMKKKN